MGNMRSVYSEDENEDIWWNNVPVNKEVTSRRPSYQSSAKLNISDNEDRSLNQMSEENREKLNEFKLEFARKHEKRRQILAEKRKEMQDLREEVRRLTKENEDLKASSKFQGGQNKNAEDQEEIILEVIRVQKENEDLKAVLREKSDQLEKSEILLSKNNELRIHIAEMQKELQDLNKEIFEFEKERHDYQAHVVALKDVIAVSKQMLNIRESQLKELKQKVESIEASLAGREMNILSQDLRNEYERQLQNIRNLRTLYEERQRTDRREKEDLLVKLEESKREVEIEQNKNKELQQRITELEEENSKKYDDIMSLESNLGLTKAESRQYQAELTVINQLFSEILLGFNSSQDIDLDKLTKHLEEHHELLQNIVINEISSETSAALPKVLLDLVNQVSDKESHDENSEGLEDALNKEENKKLETIVEESESQTSTVQMNSAEEIVELLPKVWRVLIELLSQHKAPINNLTDDDVDEHPCYKTVQTPKGPSLVLSVSQTFIRLKDLILEKKSLEKETNHLKQLNTHLESRLQDQEKRLEMVSSELSKTWHVVGKLQKQHQLLHTQEKILRYELAQKRKLLVTLREELEYSREKWQQAREKNSTTEKQWKQLRVEFASRRNTIVNDDFNNSTESGYSDERCSSSDDEPGYETDISEGNQKIAPGIEPEDTSDIEAKVIDDIQTSEAIAEPCCSVAIAQNISELENKINEEMEHTNTTKEQPEPTTIEDKTEYSERLMEACISESATEPTVLEMTINEDIEQTNDDICTNAIEGKTLSEQVQQNGFVPITKICQGVENNMYERKEVEGISLETSSGMPEKIGKESVREDGLSTHSDVANQLKTDLLESNEKTESRNVEARLGDTNQEPGTSRVQPKRTFEEILAAKEERLKRLEGQCQQLVEKVTNTTTKSVIISNKLDDLHEVYGEGSSSSQETTLEVPSAELDLDSNNNNQE